MKLQLKLEINYKSLKDFKIGAEFTKDELLKYSKEFKTPEDWTLQEVISTVKHNWKEDINHASWWLKTRFTRIKYIVQSVRVNKNFMYVVMVVSSPIFLGLGLANTMVDTQLTTNINTVTEVKKVAEKPHKKLKKAVKKEAAKMKEIRKEHKLLMKELGISELPKKPLKSVKKEVFSVNPNETRLWETIANTIPSGTFVGSFADSTFKIPIQEQHRRLVAVYNFYKKIEDDYQINALVAAAQFSVETNNGQSRLINMGNNIAGCKEFRKDFPFLRAHDDGNDLDETGKSRFRKYYSIEDGLLDYAGGVISKPLYINARKHYKSPNDYLYAIQHLAWNKKNKDWIRYADNDDYMDAVQSRIKLIKKLVKL